MAGNVDKARQTSSRTAIGKAIASSQLFTYILVMMHGDAEIQEFFTLSNPPAPQAQ